MFGANRRLKVQSTAGAINQVDTKAARHRRYSTTADTLRLVTRTDNARLAARYEYDLYWAQACTIIDCVDEEQNEDVYCLPVHCYKCRVAVRRVYS